MDEKFSYAYKKTELNSPKRFIVNVDENLHAEVKTHASFRHMSLTRWITQAMVEKLLKEDIEGLL